MSEWYKILGGVIVGWFLGWGNLFLVEYLQRRRLRRQLIEELTVLQDRLHTMHLGYVRGLQCLAHGIADNTYSLKLEHPIYTNFYKDVCSYLNLEQRTSYELIHGLVDAVNQHIQDEKAVLRELAESNNAKKIDQWGSLAKSQFINICALKWYIHSHLENRTKPTIDAESYRTDRKGAHRKIEEILEKAKGLDIVGGIVEGGGTVRIISDKEY
jgi:hypothetical protein